MKPVRIVRIGSEGMSLATTEPSPQLKMTIFKPKKRSSAVPIASATKSLYSNFGIITD
jgi:hypothetical protein